jgi:hypothetical protein
MSKYDQVIISDYPFEEVDWPLPMYGGLWGRREGGIWCAGWLSGGVHVSPIMSIATKWQTREERTDLVGGWVFLKILSPFPLYKEHPGDR